MAGISKLVSVLVFAMLAALIVPSTNVTAAYYYREGDMWLYNVTEYVDDLEYSGIWNSSYQGIVARVVEGDEQDVHLFRSIWEFQVTGSYENATVSGTERVVDDLYAELNDYDTVMTETNQSMDWTLVYPPNTYAGMEGWMYNVSIYSPPGGIGDDPSYIQVGDEWTVTYPIEYTTTEFDGLSTVQYSGSTHRTIHYTVLDSETVAVPAGSFSCTVIHEEYDDGGATRWISSKAGSDVKIVAYYESGEEFSAELMYYSFGQRAGGPGSTTALGVSVAVAAGTIALVFFLFLRKRKRQPESEKQTTYDPSRPPVSPPGEIL